MGSRVVVRGGGEEEWCAYLLSLTVLDSTRLDLTQRTNEPEASHSPHEFQVLSAGSYSECRCLWRRMGRSDSVVCLTAALLTDLDSITHSLTHSPKASHSPSVSMPRLHYIKHTLLILASEQPGTEPARPASFAIATNPSFFANPSRQQTQSNAISIHRSPYPTTIDSPTRPPLPQHSNITPLLPSNPPNSSASST